MKKIFILILYFIALLSYGQGEDDTFRKYIYNNYTRWVGVNKSKYEEKQPKVIQLSAYAWGYAMAMYNNDAETADSCLDEFNRIASTSYTSLPISLDTGRVASSVLDLSVETNDSIVSYSVQINEIDSSVTVFINVINDTLAEYPLTDAMVDSLLDLDSTLRAYVDDTIQYYVLSTEFQDSILALRTLSGTFITSAYVDDTLASYWTANRTNDSIEVKIARIEYVDEDTLAYYQTATLANDSMDAKVARVEVSVTPDSSWIDATADTLRTKRIEYQTDTGKIVFAAGSDAILDIDGSLKDLAVDGNADIEGNLNLSGIVTSDINNVVFSSSGITVGLSANFQGNSNLGNDATDTTKIKRLDVSEKVVIDDSLRVNSNLHVKGNTNLNGILFTGSTKTAGAEYTGTTNPTNTNRKNYDGYLYVTGINSSSGNVYTTNANYGIYSNNSNYGVYGATSGTSGIGVYGESASNNATSHGVKGSTWGGYSGYFTAPYTLNNNATILLRLERNPNLSTYNATGDIISILDNPTTSGTISGKILSATIGSTERISLNPRTASGNTNEAYLFDTHLKLNDAKHTVWMNQADTLAVLDSIRGLVLKGQLKYDDTFWGDLTVSAFSLAEGVNAPSLRTYLGGVQAYAYNYATADDYSFGQAQLEHSYKAGTNIKAHCHVSIETAPGAGDSIYIGLEYTWADINETFPTTDTLYVQQNVSGWTAKTHYLVDFGTITGSGHTESSVIMFRFVRLQSNSKDTYDSSNDWMFLHDIDFHFEMDKPGSNNEIP